MHVRYGISRSESAISVGGRGPAATGVAQQPAVVAEQRTFRRVMGRFGTGVTVITTATEGRVFGMTANAFMAGSLAPPLCVISVARTAKMHARLTASGRFGVSFLGEHQAPVSQHFAGIRALDSGPDFRWLGDVPVLRGSVGVVAANVVDATDCGDHTLFVGQIVAMDADEGQPLLFHAGRYCRLERERRIEDAAPSSFW